MKEQFINSKIIGIIYKNLVSKLNLQLNSEEKIKYNENNFNRMSEDNFNRMSEDNFNRMKENNFNNLKEDEDSLIKSRNTDLDYLYYEENNKNTKSKNKKNKSKKNKVRKLEIKEENNINKEIRFYIYLFILFYSLNSYYVINLINSYKIQYYLSLAIRSSLFLIFYYLIKRFS